MGERGDVPGRGCAEAPRSSRRAVDERGTIDLEGEGQRVGDGLHHRGQLRPAGACGDGDVRHPLARSVVLVESAPVASTAATTPTWLTPTLGVIAGASAARPRGNASVPWIVSEKGPASGSTLQRFLHPVDVPPAEHGVRQVGVVVPVRVRGQRGDPGVLQTRPEVPHQAFRPGVEEQADRERHALRAGGSGRRSGRPRRRRQGRAGPAGRASRTGARPYGLTRVIGDEVDAQSLHDRARVVVVEPVEGQAVVEQGGGLPEDLTRRREVDLGPRSRHHLGGLHERVEQGRGKA